MVAAGAYLRSYRKRRKLTQGNIAEALRLSGARVVTDWEYGKRRPLADIFALWVEMVGANPTTVSQLILGGGDATTGRTRAEEEFVVLAINTTPRNRAQLIAEIQTRLDRLAAEAASGPTATP